MSHLVIDHFREKVRAINIQGRSLKRLYEAKTFIKKLRDVDIYYFEMQLVWLLRTSQA
ncbi:MAG: hypothetical protein NOM71_02625 [Archaeoglobi archaeon]|nr:hypothetical protein [Archaeoglobi archaeon]